jgi:hypothetical protein
MTTQGIRVLARGIGKSSGLVFIPSEDVEKVKTVHGDCYGIMLVENTGTMAIRINFKSVSDVGVVDKADSVDVFTHSATPALHIVVRDASLASTLTRMWDIIKNKAIGTHRFFIGTKPIGADTSAYVDEKIVQLMEYLGTIEGLPEEFPEEDTEWHQVLAPIGHKILVKNGFMTLEGTTDYERLSTLIRASLPSIVVERGTTESYYANQIEMDADRSYLQSISQGVADDVAKRLKSGDVGCVIATDCALEGYGKLLASIEGSGVVPVKIDGSMRAPDLISKLREHRTETIVWNNVAHSIADKGVRDVLVKLGKDTKTHRLEDADGSFDFKGALVVCSQFDMKALIGMGYTDFGYKVSLSAAEDEVLVQLGKILNAMEGLGLSEDERKKVMTVLKSKSKPTLRKLCRIIAFARSGAKAWVSIAMGLV